MLLYGPDRSLMDSGWGRPVRKPDDGTGWNGDMVHMPGREWLIYNTMHMYSGTHVSKPQRCIKYGDSALGPERGLFYLDATSNR